MSNHTTNQDAAASALTEAVSAIIKAENANNKRYESARVAMRRLTDTLGLAESTDETTQIHRIGRLLSVELGRVKFKENDGTPSERAKKPYVTNKSLDAAYRRLYKALREVLKERGYQLKAKANDPTERDLGRVLIEIERDSSQEETKQTKGRSKDGSANEANLEGAGGEGEDAGDTTLADVSSMDDAGREALAAELVGSMGAASLSRLQEVIEARMTALADEAADEAGIDTADMDEGEYDEYDDEAQRLVDALSA